MRYRQLGRTGIKVSEVGFGTSRIGGMFASAQGGDDPLKVLASAFEAGITFYDTADMYSNGESEKLLGRAFRGKRDNVVIASKGGYCLPSQRKLISRIKPLVKPIIKALGIKRENLPSAVSGSLSQDFSPAYLVSAVEASLQRMQTDYIDVYQLHSPPPDVIRAGEYVETMETLKRQGKILHWGIAADTPADAVVALEHGKAASIQMPFGLLDLEATGDALYQAQRQGAGVIARGCFGGGLLKESLTEAELKERTEKWPQVLQFRKIAAETEQPIMEMALQFALAGPSVSVAILGMHSCKHVEQNLKYAEGAPMDEELWLRLAAVKPAGGSAGASPSHG